MKKLNDVIYRFLLEKEKDYPFQTVTIDLFDTVLREANMESITRGDNACMDYEVRIVVEVMDQNRFPADYMWLSKLLKALEDLEN